MMDAIINVADEEPRVTEILADLLELHGYVIRKHLSLDTLLRDLPHQNRSISLVSFGLPERGATRFLQGIQNRQFATLAVMMSSGVETSRIVEAIKAGAEDVIEKPLSVNELLMVVQRSVSKVNNLSVVQPTLSNAFFESLTPEEISIFELLEQGATIKKIAATLDISIRTVHYRKKSILTKTESKNRTEIVAKLSSARSTMTA